MRYQRLGSSGLRVSELCLGTMTFGEDWGWGASEAESRRIFDAFVEAGGNFIDTANFYTQGTAETLVGRFVAGARDRFVLSTKYTLYQRRGDPNAGGNHRKSLAQAIEGSLRRLNTDYIDVYWVHAWDGLTPIEEVLRALDDAVRAGQVLYAGISDTPAWVIAQANTIAALRGLTPFCALQAPYNLLERELEADLLPMAQAFGINALAWGPLSSGKLSGKHSGDAPAESKRMRRAELSERETAVIAVVQRIAAEVGRSPAQVAINWIRQRPQHPRIIPILGARTEAQIRDNLGCLEWALTPEQIAQLDEVSAIPLWFPHDFLQAPMARDLIFGGTYEQIDQR